MEFFVSYSEQDRDLERLVSEALAVHGHVSGRAAVESGGIALIDHWIVARAGGPSVVICLISASYLEYGSEIANTVLRTDNLVAINVYLENVERSPASLLRPGIPLEGLDRARAAYNLEVYFETLLNDPDLFAPMPESGSMGMASSTPEPLSLDELLERRAAVRSDTPVSALEAEMALRPPLAQPAAPAPMQPQPEPIRTEPEPMQAPIPTPPPDPPRRARSRANLLPWLVVGAAALLAAVALKDWLAHLLAGAAAVSQGMVQPAPAQAQPELVDVSAFAPQGGAPGEKVLVQILLHTEGDLRRASSEARRADAGAARRMTATLTEKIALGQLVTVMLEGDDVAVDEPVLRIVWHGQPAAVQFLVLLSSHVGNAYLRCRLLVDSVPVGSLRFTLRVSPSGADKGVEMRGDLARRHRSAFLSYASADRAEVLKRVQGLNAAGIDTFQDVLSLRPGDTWEPRLYEAIDRCDLFLLFWSSNAAKSEWVTREIEHAVARQRATDGSPEITPVIIEGPPVARPIPESLRHMHFNDYLMLAAMSEPRDRPQA